MNKDYAGTFEEFVNGEISILVPSTNSEQYRNLMQRCEEASLKWAGGETPTAYTPPKERDEKLLIQHIKRGLTYSLGGYYKPLPVFEYEELIPETQDTYELHISCRDGKTTHAVYKKNGQIVERTKALCNPEDKFSFIAGALVALSRLNACTEERPVWANLTLDKKEEPAKPVKPSEPLWKRVKVGDRVRFKQAPFSYWNAAMKQHENQVFTVRHVLDGDSRSNRSIILVDENIFCYMCGDVAEIL